MSGSGNSINYDLRTAKSVERRMISSSAKELFKSIAYKQRRYIGFGSTYFTDFKLFHKELHIGKMISFELKEDLEKRAAFNKPFKCIDIKIGKSTNLLPSLDWGKGKVDLIWMDYDEKLQYDYFNDIEIIFTNIGKGSIYVMTCNKQLHNYLTTEQFSDVFGELVPNNIHTNDFSGENDYLLIRNMLFNKINEVLKNRNYSLPDEEQLIFRQLFFFTYRDGAPMISYGGFIDLKINKFDLKDYNLKNFDFIKTDVERYIINPPIITHKEIVLLNSCLPNTEKAYKNKESIKFIPEKDRESYRQLYKFLPNYMDVMY